MNLTFLLSHGWGLDAAFWRHLCPYLPGKTLVMDQGYFGVERPPLFPLAQPVIGIGHSLGFVHLIQLHEQGVNFKALVGLQGFIDFLGKEASLRNKRTREWQCMGRYFTQDPRTTLESFHQRAGYKGSVNLSALNMTKLWQDMEMLGQSYSLPVHIPLLIVGAYDDPIVPEVLLKDNFEGRDVTFKMVEKGAHVLGRVHAKEIWDLICGFLAPFL